MSEISKLNGYDIKDKKSIRSYDTVSSMKSDTALKEGQHVKTKGYYNSEDGGHGEYIIIDDNTLVENGLVLELTNGLRAKLIINDNTINVKQLGAKNDGSEDISTILQTAINNFDTIYFPNGIYIINDTIYLKNDLIIKGENKFKTILTHDNSIDLSKPIFTTDTTDEQYQYVCISFNNLSITTFGDRTQHVFYINNCNTFKVENCCLSQNAINDEYYENHDVYIGRTINSNTATFLTTIKNNRFRRFSINMASTDSYILNNEIWCNELPYALQIRNSSNTLIQSNELVGGNVYGAIYISGVNEGLRILNNYFDGSYDTIDTKYGIYCTSSNIMKSIISNNNFWKQKSAGIYISKLQFTTISNNVFNNCDYYNNGEPDIIVDDEANSFGNTISNNIFYRDYYYDQATGTTILRPTTNTPPVIKLLESSSYQNTLVTNNTCSFTQFYSDMLASGNIYSRNNNTTKFYYTYNPTISNTKNDKDIIYNTSDKTLNCIVNNSQTRIDNIKPELITDKGSFDFDAKSSIDYMLYINNQTLATNIPSYATNVTNALVIYKAIVGNAYAMQILINVDGIKHRSLINNVWSDWI